MSEPAVGGTVRTSSHGPVRILTLSNPGARNALSPAIYEAGLAAIAAAVEDPAIRAVLLHGEDGFFCAGGNLNRLRANREADPALQQASIDKLNRWVTALRECPKPIVAAVEGAAAGAGFSVALACDLIVAARDARFVMAYARVGLSPDGGATVGLAAALAPQRAFAILALADPVGADELQHAGIVHALAEPGEAVAAGLALAERLAAGPSAVHARLKRLIASANRQSLASQLDDERDAFVRSLYDEDGGEGIAAFLEKRAPRFQGR